MAKAPHGQSKGDDDGLLKGAAVEIMDRLFGMRKRRISGNNLDSSKILCL
jgi:hypothetical protein